MALVSDAGWPCLVLVSDAEWPCLVLVSDAEWLCLVLVSDAEWTAWGLRACFCAGEREVAVESGDSTGEVSEGWGESGSL